MKIIALAVLLSATAVPALAQGPAGYPDAPSPKPAVENTIWQDRPVLWLAAATAGSQIADIKTTQDSLSRGNHEDNPIYGHDPSVGRMVAFMVPENIATAYIGHKMRTSNVTVFRKTWWIPQTITIVVHADAATHNTRVN